MSNDLLTLINTTTNNLERYARVDELIKELSKEKADLRKAILADMDGRDKLIQGEFVATVRKSVRNSIDTKKLYADFGEEETKALYGKQTEVQTLTVK